MIMKDEQYFSVLDECRSLYVSLFRLVVDEKIVLVKVLECLEERLFK